MHNNFPILIYLALFAFYRIVEYFIMHQSGTLKNLPGRDWSAYLIIVPFYLIVIGPLIEYLCLNPLAGKVNMILGGIFFLAATYIRGRAHLDLRGQFSMRLEKMNNIGFTQTGLYQLIRHPLYLGNLCLFIACPLFLSVFYSWFFTLIGIIGILVRIRIEEKFMLEAHEGYREYIKNTSALLPGIF